MQVYPKNFAATRRSIELNTCFVLMPFDEDFNLVYGLIKDCMDRLGIKCNRADDLYESQPVLSLLFERLLRSEFIIADLTNRNPNVYYEVGVAHSFRDTENVILMAQDMSDIPFDLLHLPIIIYSQGNKYLLSENLKSRINTSRGSMRQKRFLLDYFADSKFSFSTIENFIDKIQVRDHSFVEKLHMLLADNDEFISNQVSSFDIKDIIEEISEHQSISSKDTRDLMRKIKLSILINISDIPSFKDYCASYLNDSKREDFDSATDERLMFSADYASDLIRAGLYKSLAINWLLAYLKNSRVGCVDIVRNRVDEFLVQTNDIDVETSLLRLLNSENEALRESSVDILTQKQSPMAYQIIISKIISEKNIYVLRSMINGLSRYDHHSASNNILECVLTNKELIYEIKAYFIFDAALDYFRKFKLFGESEQVSRLKAVVS